MTQIAQALTRLFDRHRIIFWYDTKRELFAEFESLDLTGIEKIVLANNQFGVKYRILRAEPHQKFLLYHDGPAPPDLENWLLDVQLAQGEFRADQVALWLSELGLAYEFTDVVAPHAEFFRAASRRKDLKSLLKRDDTATGIRMKMLAVCARSDPHLDEIMESLLAELADDKDEKFRLIQRAELDGFLWKQLERAYGYSSGAPSIRDFSIELFKSCYAMGLDGPHHLTQDALVFLKRWKDSVRHVHAFETLSAACADILNITKDLEQRDYRTLIDLDYFEIIDRKILSDLVRGVAGRTLPAGECAKIIRQRRQTHWYNRYQHPYEAIGFASEFMQRLDRIDLSMHSLADGIGQYSRVWYALDQLYRKYVYHTRQSGLTTLLEPLSDQVENLYTNHFLLQLNNNWQAQVDASERWRAKDIRQQQDFYALHVHPFLQKNNKVFVIISDAMRYEVGEELLGLIRQEDRYDAKLEPAITVLPSFTQLGMAALLPHETLTLHTDGKVLVDGNNTQGTENRKKILGQALPERATALQAKNLLQMSRDESRALMRDHDVVYVYHNRIDAVGDKRDSEERVFEAVEATLDELVKIIKRLANANVSNMLVTADHGFIYQDRPLDESDFASDASKGEEIVTHNRRYVLGSGLIETTSFKKFVAGDVGLTGDVEMLIPKSINRLRVSGAGSRYVHGGATLQEVVIPILQINKKRQSDVSFVDVDILRGSTSTITTGQLTVAFYQTKPVSAKLQPRSLRAGIYTQAGDLISDQHELTFDFTSDNARDRESPVQFVFTRHADEANNQDVILRLEQRVADTSHYREYKSALYLLRRSFTSDFDW